MPKRVVRVERFKESSELVSDAAAAGFGRLLARFKRSDLSESRIRFFVETADTKAFNKIFSEFSELWSQAFSLYSFLEAGNVFLSRILRRCVDALHHWIKESMRNISFKSVNTIPFTASV